MKQMVFVTPDAAHIVNKVKVGQFYFDDVKNAGETIGTWFTRSKTSLSNNNWNHYVLLPTIDGTNDDFYEDYKDFSAEHAFTKYIVPDEMFSTTLGAWTDPVKLEELLAYASTTAANPPKSMNGGTFGLTTNDSV